MKLGETSPIIKVTFFFAMKNLFQHNRNSMKIFFILFINNNIIIIIIIKRNTHFVSFRIIIQEKKYQVDFLIFLMKKRKKFCYILATLS